MKIYLSKLISVSSLCLCGCVGSNDLTVTNNDLIISDDLTNKGLICQTVTFDEMFSNVGFWFTDNTTFEKWFNGSVMSGGDGFGFVRIEKDLYTSYEVTFSTIELNYSQTKDSKPFDNGETIDRHTLKMFFSGGYVGDCSVVTSKDEFVGELKKISDHYRKIKKRKI